MAQSIIAAGHPITADVAASVLRSGGNAFDAAASAVLAASVCEPALASLGGGGFLMAHPADDRPALIDFFSQTPRQRRDVADLDVDSFVCDFGSAQQTFRIGAGTSAVPGCVKGVFAIARELGRMSMHDLIQPACEALEEGIEVNEAQAHLIGILTPIFMNPSARKIYESAIKPGVPVQRGERVRLPEYVDLLETLAIEGEDLFYRGEVAEAIDEIARDAGGSVTREDLANYEVEFRKPLLTTYRNCKVMLNPPPSVGGVRLAVALSLLEKALRSASDFGSKQHFGALLDTMAKLDELAQGGGGRELDVDPRLLDQYRAILERARIAARGTTHISIVDGAGNAAALTLSNGEGCGVMIPGTGVMLNNMLGEDDLNPGGLEVWPLDRRLGSMMCPSVAYDGSERLIVLGSGGSNRIPFAIMQVLSNLVDFGMSVERAVHSPRVHVNEGVAYAEDFASLAGLDAALAGITEQKRFPAPNVFFGGVHAACATAQGVNGSGDPRRGGICVYA